MRRPRLCAAIVAGILLAGPLAAGKDKPMSLVRVSPRDPRYFELSDGRAFVPIGLNMIQPPFVETPEERLAGMERWMKALSANGGNYLRVWLGAEYWDVEHARSGAFDEAKAQRIDALLALARKHGLRLKMTLEHFRDFDGKKAWCNKAIHHVANGGPAESIADFFDGAKPREQFQRKLAWFAKRYRNDPAVFGWELWNEMDCVRAGDYVAWTEVMLAELHRLIPDVLAMQSFGSFDNDSKRARYRRLWAMKGNDVAQVHRYLDLGARLEVCHGPVDVLAADAVGEVLSCRPGRPVLLAESGAVEPSHSGPFKLYAADKAGTILHDVLFAPFFAGAAGGGQIWHWDDYVDRNDLWWQFGRFAKAVEGLDPPAEGFVPMRLDTPRLRVHVLAGKRTLLAWCRDVRNTWKAELAEGKAPETVRAASVDLGKAPGAPAAAGAETYDPWRDVRREARLDGTTVALPDFQRSIVVRLRRSAVPRGAGAQ